jgi:periplasmic mercuric ion binding protein
MKNILFILFLFISFGSLKAQSQQNAIQDSAIIVNGVCGMCQNVIEKAAALPGVQEAKWNKDTKVLKLKYSADKVSIESIYKAVAASGYDTEFLAAPEEAYQGLHGCCKYRDPAVLEEHK